MNENINPEGVQPLPPSANAQTDPPRETDSGKEPVQQMTESEDMSGEGRLAVRVFTADGAKQLGGFGAIGSLFPPTWDWMMFWRMTAFLSIILAFMNILPIPALDGGHVLFLLYEMITRRKPSEKFLIC